MVHLSVCRLWPYDMACRMNSGRHFSAGIGVETRLTSRDVHVGRVLSRG